MNNRLVFNKINKALLLAGIILLIIGYYLMSLGDIIVSPLIITISYIIVIPMAIIWGVSIGTKNNNNQQDSELKQKNKNHY